MMAPRRRALLWRLATGGLVLAVLAGVFALYAQPAMMVALADLMWACFN